VVLCRAAELGREAARLTHDHPIGQDGAGLHAAVVARLTGRSLDEPFDDRRFAGQLDEHAITRRFRDILAAIPTSPERAPDSAEGCA
jgi:ADP-ribosylglycohydrolase